MVVVVAVTTTAAAASLHVIPLVLVMELVVAFFLPTKAKTPIGTSAQIGCTGKQMEYFLTG